MIRRVFMTADAVGGVWNYSLDLARWLSSQGIQVGLATMGAVPTNDQIRRAHSIPNLELFTSEYRLEWSTNPWDDVERAGGWLLDRASSFDPDVVHLNGFCHGKLSWNVPTVMVFHSCVLSWFQGVRGHSAPPEWSRYRREVELGLRSADQVIAPTRAILNEADKIYGPFRASAVIPNAADPRAFGPRPKEPFVFAAGRVWDEAKNIRLLDQIASCLEWPVFIAGDEGSTQPYMAAHLIGKLPSEELATWLGRAAIYALPAKYEPFGLSVLEAALSGCALVLGDIPTLRENWSDCALFVDPSSEESLRSAIRMLIHDSALRTRLGSAARQRGLQFSPEAFGAAYLDHYESLSRSRCKQDPSPNFPFAVRS